MGTSILSRLLDPFTNTAGPRHRAPDADATYMDAVPYVPIDRYSPRRAMLSGRVTATHTVTMQRLLWAVHVEVHGDGSVTLSMGCAGDASTHPALWAEDDMSLAEIDAQDVPR